MSPFVMLVRLVLAAGFLLIVFLVTIPPFQLHVSASLEFSLVSRGSWQWLKGVPLARRKLLQVVVFQAQEVGGVKKFRAVFAFDKSYVLSYCAETGKWPLTVCVTNKMTLDHQGFVKSLFEEIQTKALTKEQALELRAKRLAPAVD